MQLASYYLVLFLAGSFQHTTSAGVRGTITSYGITAFTGKEVIVESPLSPTGARRIAKSILIDTTNRIHAHIGLSFGITYEIENLPVKDGELVKVIRTITFPPMAKPDGSRLNRVEATFDLIVKNRRAYGETGYTFEHAYELVPGLWDFTLSLGGKTLCKQTFVVSVE